MINPNSRFLRSRPARAKLWLDAFGKCKNCGKYLDTIWHADHYIPWSKGGKTKLSNLQALCEQCNISKGDIMPSPIEYERMNHFKENFPLAKIEKIRQCQIGGFNCIFENIVKKNKKACSIHIATGGGKSDLIRLAALGLTKHFAGVWAFSPSVHLRDQLKGDRVEEFLERCQYPVENGKNPFISVDGLDQPCFRNNTKMESFTTQFLTTNGNVELFIKRANMVFRETGLYPLVVFDESQLFSTDNEWGKAARRMQDAGMPIVLVTGTPYRADKMQIPDFELKQIDKIIRPFVKTRKDSSNPLVIQVERGTSEVCKYELVADYEYSYQRAWEDGVILKPAPHFVDAVEIVSEQIVSEMPISEIGRLLRIFLMDDRTISSCVFDAISSIRLRKNSDYRCAAIVTSLSDDEDNMDNIDNYGDIHARKIEREFKKQAPDLKVLVVTSNNNSDGGLDIFEKKNFDVLIVKAMGTIGYNCPRIKTVLHLSNYRTLPAFVQLANRGCRCYEGNADYDLIMPKDKGMVALWHQFIESTHLIVEDKTDTLISSDEIESSQNETKRNDAGFDQHSVSFDPNTKRSNTDEMIEKYNQAFPENAHKHIPQEKIDIYIKLSSALGDDCFDKIINSKTIQKTVLLDCNEEESRLRSEANDIVKEITKEILTITRMNTKDHYGQIVKNVWTKIKRDCGFRPNQTIEKLSGIDNFQRIINAANNLKTGLLKKSEDTNFDYERYLGINSRRISLF